MHVFEFDKVFNLEDYLYVYSPMLTPKTSLLQADFIADSLKLKKAKFFVRLYTYAEIKTLLSQVELEIIASFGSYNINEEYDLNSNRMIIIAEKR